MTERKSYELFNELERIEPVNEKSIDKAFDDLIANQYHILVFEIRPMPEKSSFIQVVKEKSGYTLELQYKRANEIQQFRKETLDGEECRKQFLNYFYGQLPDYKSWTDVTAEVRYYFDFLKNGIQKETSHPFFVHHFSNNFYYDSMDVLAPFGNDIGNDSLRLLEEFLKMDEVEEYDLLPERIAERWDVHYFDPVKMSQNQTLNSVSEEGAFLSSQLTVGVGFGLIKITGGISTLMKRRTLYALEQLMRLLPDWKEVYLRQIEALETFQSYDE